MLNRIDDDHPRTNNNVEGWHRSFQSHISSCHPMFWKFLNILHNEESLIHVSIIQHLVGHPPPPQRQRYLDCNRRILAIVDDFPNCQTLQYLRSIAPEEDCTPFGIRVWVRVRVKIMVEGQFSLVAIVPEPFSLHLSATRVSGI